MLKHLFEYDASELADLLGDLGELGLETLQGWIIIWYGEYDVPHTEIIVAPSANDALAIYLHRGYFGPDFQKLLKNKWKDSEKENLTDFIKNNESIKGNFALWFGLLVKSGKVNKFTSVNNLRTKDGVKSPSYSSLEENPDPYHQINIFENLFTNSKDRFNEAYKSKTSKKGLVTIPFDSEEYAPENRIKSGGWMP